MKPSLHTLENWIILCWFSSEKKIRQLLVSHTKGLGQEGISFVYFLWNSGKWGADFNHTSLSYQSRTATRKGAVFWTCFPSKLRGKGFLARLSQLQLEALERTHRHLVEKLQEIHWAKTGTWRARTHGGSPRHSPPSLPWGWEPAQGTARHLTAQGKAVPFLETVLCPLSHGSFIPLLPNYGHIVRTAWNPWI